MYRRAMEMTTARDGGGVVRDAVFKRSARLIGALVLLGLMSGCPFEFGDAPSAPGSCSRDSQCPANHACSELSKSCVLWAPAPEPMRIVGPFRCPLGDIRFGGSAFVASWPAFDFQSGEGDQQETLTFPETIASLDYNCFIAPSGDDNLILQADSGRRYSRDFNQVIFWRFKLMIPRGQLGPGVQQLQPTNSFVYWCPGTPDEAAWRGEGTENCVGVMRVDPGTIAFDFERYEEFKELAGYIDLELGR